MIRYIDNDVKKHTTVIGLGGVRYESCREACDNHDYEAAHRFITLMSKEKMETILIDEATEYVFQNEVSYLLAEMGEDANTRVLLLIKELPSGVYSDGYCDYVLNLAIITGNKKLANDVIALYKDERQKDVARERIQRAVESGKFED